MTEISESNGAAALALIKNAAVDASNGEKLPSSILDAWASIPSSVRSALVASELSKTMHRSETQPTLALSRSATSSTSTFSSYQSDNGGSEDGKSDEGGNETDSSNVSFVEAKDIVEECPQTGAKIHLRPLPRAPNNVFEFSKTQTSKTQEVKKTPSSVVTTTTKVVSSCRGWRNIFTLPISYDVNMVPHGTIFEPENPRLLEATGAHPKDYNQRFAVIDEEVDRLYGDKIRSYFVQRKIELSTCVLSGGEATKRPEAVETLLDQLCAYKLRRREPFLAIGGGVLLDIAGMAANLYRRGVPFVRVPTTLLAIVDASVGVKNGVDYCCGITDETYKNRVGSFYAPSSCLLDNSFIASQDKRNVANGMGEILKLALVRSSDLFELLEAHGPALVESRFGPNSSTPEGVSDRIVDSSIQIMLEELGPNLWEKKLDRCVDYGHTFSKLLEMVPGADIMHGEAVNVDGFFCVVLSHLRGYVDENVVNRVLNCMKSLSLPTNSSDLNLKLAWQSCKDAVEHRHGEQRIPLITEIGHSICANDITEDELERALEYMSKIDH